MPKKTASHSPDKGQLKKFILRGTKKELEKTGIDRLSAYVGSLEIKAHVFAETKEQAKALLDK